MFTLRRFLSAKLVGSSSDVARRHLRNYGLIVGIFVALLAISLAASWAAIDVIDATRTYATGEGRYSKAEKIAVLNLHRYAYSAAAADYARFNAAMAIPLGDRLARMSLQRSPPDLIAANAGLLAGNNHVDDLPGAIRLFRRFSWWKPFAAAVADWRQGDVLNAQLIAKAADLHARIVSHALDSERRATMLAVIDEIDDRLTTLENTFSTHLGEAARTATRLVVLGLGITTVALWAIGIAFATRLLRRQLALDHQLAGSETRFRDYAEVASDWYWELDVDNRITYMSERFYAMSGLTPDVVLGRNGGDFIKQNTLSETHRETFLTALGDRERFRGVQLRYTRAGGTTTSYWSIAGKPHVDAHGQFCGYRGVGSDITSLVRDAEVLREAMDRAVVANRAKSEFLANMSHELRTPLNAILGFSDIIQRRMLGRDAMDRYTDYARDIHRSGEHLLAIIDDILDLSKVESGRAELKEEECEVASIVGTVRTLLGDRFETGGIRFEIDAADQGLHILADERKIVQVLLNLLSNARKFTPEGGTVVLAVAPQISGDLAISVRDTGIGIKPADIEMVLSPFGQVESAFSRKHHGTGLGLPLSKSLVELHGGKLILESTPDVGTTVTVILPAERVIPADEKIVATA